MLDKISYELGVKAAMEKFAIALQRPTGGGRFAVRPTPAPAPAQAAPAPSPIRGSAAPVNPSATPGTSPLPAFGQAAGQWWQKAKGMAGQMMSHPMGQMGAMMVGGPIVGNIVNRMMTPSDDRR